MTTTLQANRREHCRHIMRHEKQAASLRAKRRDPQHAASMAIMAERLRRATPDELRELPTDDLVMIAAMASHAMLGERIAIDEQYIAELEAVERKCGGEA